VPNQPLHMETVWRQCLVGNGKMIGSSKSSGFAMPNYKLNWRQRGGLSPGFAARPR
jgi:hypothetical protein